VILSDVDDPDEPSLGDGLDLEKGSQRVRQTFSLSDLR
jgi:hypothetical protein